MSFTETINSITDSLTVQREDGPVKGAFKRAAQVGISAEVAAVVVSGGIFRSLTTAFVAAAGAGIATYLERRQSNDRKPSV